MNKKFLAMALALVLLIGGVVSGSLAWLTDKTDDVTNTFTKSNIDITLTETTGNEYQMIPGHTITKNPVVTVEKDSEKCYLFVEAVKSDNFDTFMTYAIADGWTELSGNPGIYWRVVDKSENDQEFQIIAGDTVTVKNTVNKSNMDGLNENNRPTLTFTAYAVQYATGNSTAEGATNTWADAAAAWAEASNPTT